MAGVLQSQPGMRTGAMVLSVMLAWPAFAGEAEYRASVRSIAGTRSRLGRELGAAATPRERAAVLARARTFLVEALRDRLAPAWFGTPWEFHGTTETPGEGAIACGYLVSTLLRDAGFAVERVRLAQQASELIVRTLSPERDIRRFRSATQAEDAEATRERGDGAYVVGLDYHVGLLVIREGKAEFCHSAYLGPAVVTCEPAAGSAGMASSYHVVGPVTSDATVARWLGGEPFPTRRR